MATAWKWIKPLLMVIVAFAGWQLFRGTAFPQIALGFAIVGALHCVATLALASINRTSRGARRTLNSWLRATLVITEAVLGWAATLFVCGFLLFFPTVALMGYRTIAIWAVFSIFTVILLGIGFVSHAKDRLDEQKANDNLVKTG